jgi:hypothetical protein
MMSIMRAELSAQADIDPDRSTPAVPPSRRLAEHPAVPTPRRSDAG